MSAASTAAAIGLTIGADDKQAIKALADLVKNLDMLEAKATSVSSELRGMAIDGLEKVTSGAGRAALSTAKWGLGLGALAATAGTVGLIDMAKDFATGAATMGRSADRLGMPVEKLSQFGIAAHLAGSSAEAMQAGLQGLQATAADAAYGRNNEAFSAFRAAGIDVGDAKRGVIDDPSRVAKIADETQRLARVSSNAAQRWLDMIGVGRELYPVLRNGSAGLQGYMDQAKSFHLTTPKDVQEARELEVVMAGLGERFSSFARIGGAAVAPGLTHFLDTLGKYLAEHQGDVTEFFNGVEHGIEWLTTPKNMAWLKKELDAATDGVKELYHWAQQMEHSPLVRRLLGLPQEAGATAGGPSVLHGIPTENGKDDEAGMLGGNIATRQFNERNRRGGGPLNDPQSLDFHPQSADPDQQSAAQESYKFWKGKGFSDAGAAAMVANEKQESSFNPSKPGDHGTAGGIMQWHQDRREAILKATGIDVWHASHQDQLEGAYREMHDRLDAGAGRAFDRMSHATSAYDAAGSAVDDFERPLDRSDNKRVRGNLAESYQRFFQKQGAEAVTAAPGAQRMAADARAGGAGDTSDAQAAASADARLARLKVEILHTNAPPGTGVQVSHDSPGYIDVAGPRTMGAMPTTGTQRNVARDGY